VNAVALPVRHLHLVQPDIEDSEVAFTEALHELDDALSGMLQAVELDGACGAIEHVMQVRQRSGELRAALDELDLSLDFLARHDEYALAR
jgi:hypothetical protein